MTLGIAWRPFGRFAYTAPPVHPTAATIRDPARDSAIAPSRPTAAARDEAGRMHHVDGMRALAALAVAFYHFRGYVAHLGRALPSTVDGVVTHGYLGVNVFFVLSGFVIAHSTARARVTGRFVGRFALRRSLRLDPPYWAAIVLAVLWLGSDPHFDRARLAPATVLAHFAYLQNLLGRPNLLDVFWTLCIEVQRYLAFVLLLWLGRALGGERRPLVRELLFAATTLGSALIYGALMRRLGAWFIDYWYMFALGAWTRWALDGGRARWWFALFLGLTLARTFLFQGPGPAVCAATAALLWLAARARPIARLLGGPALAGLGRISYSFYLLHALVGGDVLSRLVKIGPPTVLRDAAAVAVALLASLLAARLFFRAIERPSLALSRRVRLAG